MPREYKHIQKYEKEILELKSKGYTLSAIGKELGFTYKQVHNFITRYNN
jgi:DNA-binding CsgD family transcriptional regulator